MGNDKDNSRVQAAEMKFLRGLKRCIKQEHIRNTEIREELGIYSNKAKSTEIRTTGTNMLKGRLKIVYQSWQSQGRSIETVS